MSSDNVYYSEKAIVKVATDQLKQLCHKWYLNNKGVTEKKEKLNNLLKQQQE